MNSKYHTTQINDTLEKRHDVIVYIDGVLKEIKEADAFPHLNNPERKRRLAQEFRNSIEKYNDLMQFLQSLYSQWLKNMEEEEEDKDKNKTNDALLKAMLKIPTDSHSVNEELERKKYAEKLKNEFDQHYQRIMPLLKEKINLYQALLERINEHMQEQEMIALAKYKAVYESIPSSINTIYYDTEKYFGIPKKSNGFQFDEKELYFAVSKIIDATFVSEKLLYPSIQEKENINYAEEKAMRNFFIKKADEHVGFNYPNFDRVKKKECQKLIVDRAMEFMSPKRQDINRNIDASLRAPSLEIMKTRIEHTFISETLTMLNKTADELQRDHAICHDTSMDNKTRCEKMEIINSKFDSIDKMLADSDLILKDIALVFPKPLFTSEKTQADKEPSIELPGHRLGK